MKAWRISWGSARFCLLAAPGMACFRIFGYGLHLKDTRRHRLYFSERHGLRRALVLGPWRISAVRPWKVGPR